MKTVAYREYAENYQEFQEPITDAEVADLFKDARLDAQEVMYIETMGQTREYYHHER